MITRKFTIYDYPSVLEKVSLKDEIEVIKNYMEQNKIRIGNDASLSFEAKGEIASLQIAPMLLLPLVENGLKPGISRFFEGAFLDVRLSVNGNDLVFDVRNNYQEKEMTDRQGQCGSVLSDIHKRFELFYPGQYRLQVLEDNQLYQVHLKLKL
jgi:two-component system LytT family sensor kinase